MFSYCVSDSHSLRLLQPSDAEELFAVLDANRAYLRTWLPWLEANQTVADSRRFIQSTLHQLADNQGMVAAVCEHGHIVGVVGYNRFDWPNRVGYIGYWLASDHQGKGLMTASCQAMIHYGFQTLNLNRIVIAAATANGRSRAIPERLGFIHEGTAREAEWLYDHFVDHEVYACLRRDWSS